MLLRHVFPSVTHRTAGSGRPQFHGTRCRLCRCAASDQISHPSLTGPRGRAAHRVTVRGVDFSGVLPRTRFPFRHSLSRGVGPPAVSRHEVSTFQLCCLRPDFPCATHRAAGSGRPQVLRQAFATHVLAWHMGSLGQGRDYSDYRASELTDCQVSGFIFS